MRYDSTVLILPGELERERDRERQRETERDREKSRGVKGFKWLG